MNKKIYALGLFLGAALSSQLAFAVSCPVTQAALATQLIAAQGNIAGNGGFGFHMWATVVNRDGVVCAVAKSGAGPYDQWPGSRVISAQKANTANAFSLPGFALSTANLYTAVQPGGSLFGLQESNPVNVPAAYAGGNSAIYGTVSDPMVGYKIGGVNVFGGGLAMYNSGGQLIGAIGVSGDSSCADHNIAWRTRHSLDMDHVPAAGGVHVATPTADDNVVYDANNLNGWRHPICSAGAETIANGFSRAGTTAPGAAP